MNVLVLGPFEALFFDMDGTLLTSIGAVERAWTAWAVRIGAPVDELLHYMHGRRALDTITHFSPPGTNIAEEIAWLDAREHEDQGGVSEVPGAGVLLERLPADRWAIVTSANTALAHRRLQTAGLPVPRVLVSSDDVTLGKPNPEGYLRAAGLLGANITRCLAFEDTRSGLQAIMASGAYPIRIGDDPGFQGLDVAAISNFKGLRPVCDGSDIFCYLAARC